VRAGLGQIHHHRHERLDALAEVHRLGRPVVHLGIDVDRVLALPGRIHALVPEALEIGRLRARPRAADQQVPAELKVEGRQLRIVLLIGVSNPFVRRPLGGRGGAEVQRDAAKQLLMGGHMVLEHRIERPPGGPGDGLFGQCFGVAAHVLEALVAGRRRDQQDGGIRTGDGDLPIGRDDLTAGCRHGHAGLELQGAGNAGRAPVDALHHQGIGRLYRHRRLLRRLHPGRERDLAGLVRCQADHDDLIDRAGEHLSRIAHAIDRIRDGGHGGIEVEVPPIVHYPVAIGERQQQVPDALIGHLGQGLRVLCHAVRWRVIAAGNQDVAAHPGRPDESKG